MCMDQVALACFQVQALAVEASRQKRTSGPGRSQQKRQLLIKMIMINNWQLQAEFQNVTDSATNLERLHVHLHLFLGTYKEAKSVLQVLHWVWEFDQEHQRWLPVAELADPDDKGDRVYAHVWALNFRRPYVLVAVKTSNGIPIWQIAFKPNRNGSLSIEKMEWDMCGMTLSTSRTDRRVRLWQSNLN
ncbi:hypothetical protein R6Q59_021999 [Mikania micrantha]